ncbi:MAG: DUF6476 family protein [Stellaceae bacterium]
MRGLKILVIVMAVMILAGFTAIVIVISGRLSPSGPGRAPSQSFAAAPIELPSGARIETMSVGNDRLVLDILLPGGDRRLVIIELATGRTLGTIPLRTTP